MTEKKINICGQEVRICYCAATENAFENITGKSISVFVPTFGKDEKGKTIIKEPAKALTGDWMFLGIGGIIAAYSKVNQDAPVDTNKVLFEASPEDVTNLITTIVELRGQWYNVPEIIPKDEQPANYHEGEQPKN